MHIGPQNDIQRVEDVASRSCTITDWVFTNKIITSPILHQKFKFFYPWKCFYLSFMFMFFGGQIMMLRWRNSRSKIDLVIKHLVTRGSHIFSQSWWQTFDLRISFRPGSSTPQAYARVGVSNVLSLRHTNTFPTFPLDFWCQKPIRYILSNGFGASQKKRRKMSNIY